jgi:hypothetical protein
MRLEVHSEAREEFLRAPTQSCMQFLRMFYLYWRTLMVRGAQAIGGHGPSASNSLGDRGGRAFGEPGGD